MLPDDEFVSDLNAVGGEVVLDAEIEVVDFTADEIPDDVKVYQDEKGRTRVDVPVDKSQRFQRQATVVPDIPDPVYPKPIRLTETREWSPVRAPLDLFDLKLREDMFPEEGFFSKYLPWSEGATDAPRVIHFMAGLAAISISLGRNWRTPNMYELANIFGLIVSDSGTRKSTAMQHVLPIVDPDRYYTGAIGSSVALIERLVMQPTLLWYRDEADELLYVMQQKHASDIPSKLVQAYDGKDLDYQSNRQGVITAEKPYLCMLAGAALTWFRERRVTAELLRGGFLARYWIVPAKQDEVNSDPPDLDRRTQAGLQRWLRSLQEMKPCRLKLTSNARKEWRLYQECRGRVEDDVLASAWNRAPSHIQKLAMLYHAAQYKTGKDPIDQQTMLMAIRFVHELLLPGFLWVAKKLEYVGDPIRMAEQRIKEALEISGAAGEELRVVESSHGSRKTAHEALTNLFRREEISFWKWKKPWQWGLPNAGRPTGLVKLGLTPPEGRQGVFEEFVPKFIERAEFEDGTLLEEEDEPLEDATDLIEEEIDDGDLPLVDA